MAELAPGLAAAIAQARSAGREPLALLDVDLTLIDNAPRNRAIWARWAHTVRDRWPDAERAAVRAQTMPIVFGVKDNLAALGVPDAALAAEGLRYWLHAFFSDEMCRHDVPLPGAHDVVAALRDAGVTVVYLTARPAGMLEGTVATLRRFGFPVGVPGTLLALKARPETGDGAHKEQALAWLARLGEVVVVADNEPGHVNAMAGRFPAALAVHVNTRHSAGAPPLGPGVVQVAALADAALLPAMAGRARAVDA